MAYHNYLEALENRVTWLKFCQDNLRGYDDEKYKMATLNRGDLTDMKRALPMYEHSLKCGDTFFMDKHFCQLVDYARKTIPDDTAFDPTWMISPAGFLWLEDAFTLPEFQDVEKLPMQFRRMRIKAIAWFKLPEHVERMENGREVKMGPDAYEFLCFHDMRDVDDSPGFVCWSYFSLRPGDQVLERLLYFEDLGADKVTIQEKFVTGEYQRTRHTEENHEIRWVYTAMHLMSQKLTALPHGHVDRQVRRRFERDRSPIAPAFRIVTLRRRQEDQQKDPQGHQVDWQWQWRVLGHWRNQWFPATQEHKQIWIEDYIKGPVDKPLKPPTHTVFVAAR